MALTTEYANSLLRNLVSGSYIGLSTTAPSTDGTGVTEPSGGGYARVATGNSTFSADKKKVSNTAYIYFPEATEPWGVIAYLCIFSSATGGTVRYYGELTSPITVNANTVPLFRPQTINISLDS